MILALLFEPVTLYAVSLIYTTYPLASDTAVQIIVTLVVVTLASDTVGGNDGAIVKKENYKLMST